MKTTMQESPRGDESIDKAALESAQREFHGAVNAELKKLQSRGVKRSMAVLLLLKRIAGDFVSPKKEDVAKVVRKFKISEEDAVRALIVKEELVRLKREGRDSLAAVEELTNKMKNSGENEEQATQPSAKKLCGHKRGLSEDKNISTVILKRLRRIAMKDGSTGAGEPCTEEKASCSRENEVTTLSDGKGGSPQSSSKLSRKRSILKSSPQNSTFSSSNKRSKKSK